MDIDVEVDRSTQQALFERVRRHTGIVMTDRKWALLHGRLRRRLQTLALADYRDYLALLEGEAEEVGHFIDLVTTNETTFFRTPRIWDYLKQSFLPEWAEKHRGSTLQVWSAAASSGEEGYSCAMLFEEFRLTHPLFRYRILGTDISSQVLRDASAGVYQGRNLEGLRRSHPAMLERYMRMQGERGEMAPAARASISFRQHNLFKPLLEPARMDLVLLRNVLIYFDEAGQEAVLAQVRKAMAPGGILIIGESESLTRLNTGFEFMQPLVYRNRVTTHA
jgi:chemotaxis protein methyltransferase CheR